MSVNRAAILAQEQKAVDHAYACLAHTVEEREGLMCLPAAASSKDSSVLHRQLKRELAELELGGRPLTFMHVDVVENGPRETFYIGRRAVRDADGDLVVIKWTADAAVRWREARQVDPGPVRLLRRLTCDGSKVQQFFDLVSVDGSEEAEPTQEGLHATGEWEDQFLAELERSRDGSMHDIVETIQRDQLALVAQQPTGVLVIQGGPGTGKTAVGLHRVTWLLDNEHRAAGDFLVVGPSRQFLTYISDLLPQLGTTGVTTVEIASLWEAEEAPSDPLAVRRIKSDLRMATVLRRLVESQVFPGLEELLDERKAGIFTFALGRREVVVSLEEIVRIAEEAMAGTKPYRTRRIGCISRVTHRLAEAYVEALPGPALEDYFQRIADLSDVKHLFSLICPDVTATALYGQLLASRETLATSAEGILTSEEQRTLLQTEAPGSVRKRTIDDLVCLDELEYLLRGRIERTYGHVVIDEAQDLTPMQARSLARRCPNGSMTVLGDLAQATGPHRYKDWNTIAGCLAKKDGWRLAQLLTGFRVPGEVMDFAGMLATACTADIVVPSSVRYTGRQVQVVGTEIPAEEAVSQARSLQQKIAVTHGSAAIVVPDSGPWAEDIKDSLERTSADDSNSTAPSLTVLQASQCKGLEFDHVIVVEPAVIATEDEVGLNRLYVALTRCTQSLSIFHRDPLPAELTGSPQGPQTADRADFPTAPRSTTRPCSRYSAYGTKCTKETAYSDSWCRETGCAGFRTPQRLQTHGSPRPFKPPVGSDSNARLQLSSIEISRTRISAAATQSFLGFHGGSEAEAVVELKALLSALAAQGSHHRAPSGYWYLDFLGFGICLSPGADVLTRYRSAHVERSYFQVVASVPSRGRKGRNARRATLTPRIDPGPALEAADAEAFATPDTIHVTVRACAAYERAHSWSRDWEDNRFIRTLLADYAADLAIGTTSRSAYGFVLAAPNREWTISPDGRAITGMQPGHPPLETTAELTDGAVAISSTQSALSGSGQLRQRLDERVRAARRDRVHEAVRHRLLADLYEYAADAGADDLADAWSTRGDDRVLFEVVVPGTDEYASIREAALHAMEVDCLLGSTRVDHIVLVLPTAPSDGWIPDVASRAFSVSLLWRADTAWAGPAADLIGPIV